MLRSIALFLFFLCCTTTASALDQPEGGTSLFDRWAAEKQLEITLHLDLVAIEALRTSEGSLPATIHKDGQTLPLEVSVRGRYRRRTCAIPPLKLQFDKAALRAAGLNTHNDFKLVTHCLTGKAGEDALLREQLTYELYQMLAPEASFRTQRITVTYVNTADGSTTTSTAILIEDIDELQQRLRAENCKSCYAIPADNIDNAETVALFQYMIGNSDFSNRMIRNLKLLVKPDGNHVAIPYDFDFSGLVNAPYASGAEHYGERSVTERTLIWEYDIAPDFSAAIQRFQELETAFLQHVAEYPQLSNGSKREITRYLKAFYRSLSKGAPFATAR